MKTPEFGITAKVEKDLLRRAQRGDESAWSELYTAYSPMLLAYTSRIGSSMRDVIEDEEDMASEAKLAFATAVRSHDASRGCRLGTQLRYLLPRFLVRNLRSKMHRDAVLAPVGTLTNREESRRSNSTDTLGSRASDTDRMVDPSPGPDTQCELGSDFEAILSLHFLSAADRKLLRDWFDLFRTSQKDVAEANGYRRVEPVTKRVARLVARIQKALR